MPTVRRLRREDLVPSTVGRPVQLGLDELGTPLHEVTFVVVDLETTGGTPLTCAITEIGAVKVRGGEVLGEFQTLVNPGTPVPAFIQTLTGITTSMVAGAPRIEQVLPSFLEFARGSVLVAHNAPFDIGFLKAAAARCEHPWPGNQVLDTVKLARRVVLRDEAPNHKLGTLAALFGASVTPDHRALSDARATVDVLHALLSRLAPLGITHLEDLATATDPVPADVRRKRTLADGLPDAPGVYMFRGPGEEVLYVGVSGSIRTRVRSYFTAAEKRGRMTEMVRLAHAVTPVVCATTLEARVRELRLIAEHSPRYNRRSRFPERMPWIRLVEGTRPRLQIVREVQPGLAHIGPFSARSAAQLAVDALHATFVPRTPGTRGTTVLEVGSILAVRAAMLTDPAPVVLAHAARIATYIEAERFEEAGDVRNRLDAFVRGAARAQRLAPLASCAEMIAACRTDAGGWEIVLVRYGRLAGTAAVDRRTDPRAAIAALRLTAEQVAAPTSPAPAAHPEEADLLLAWLDAPGVRLVDLAPPRDPTAHDDPAQHDPTDHDPTQHDPTVSGRCCPVHGADAYTDPARTAAIVARLRLAVPAPARTA
ncbi:DEDD exonuclease domain-containing protein [Pengzhenrongella frigida]|uniref:DEDD exonuclease domain-containing protein n=1 Tax=Pengzhenrongella frigida TaxID=1259133 RepID=A0A4Q5N199_9MICO|nr:DEDD exonuclease domain-containing protein [Cellulomonas sp. HLT2-17]RYV50317.1 DEDD exonuclease domain-containing protein [Cellulomonas sp. HLT2-17]